MKKLISAIKANMEKGSAKELNEIIEKNGGKLQVIATLNKEGETELKEYVKKTLGIVKAEPTEKPAARVIEGTPLKVYHNEDGEEFAVKDGVTYKVNPIKKTLKRVSKDLSQLNVEDLPTMRFPMSTYQRYLKDKFPGDECTLKKDRLMFSGYRITCTEEDGFKVEDTQNKYEVVETPWEGIPTPKELGEFLVKPTHTFTSEEERESYERGKKILELRKAEVEKEAAERGDEPDYEHLRYKVLSTLELVRVKRIDFEAEKILDLIPFKRWKRMANNLVSKWKTRKLRYSKMLDELEMITKEETFTIRKVQPKFVGTLCPEYKEVGYLCGDRILVDGKEIEAVPFLLECLLYEEKKCMYQIMKYAKGEISLDELLEEPKKLDKYVAYDKRALANTEENAQILTLLFDAVGLVPPQDLLYKSTLKVGDKIWVWYDGEKKRKTVASVDKGIILGREEGLLKMDRWIKINIDEKD